MAADRASPILAQSAGTCDTRYRCETSKSCYTSAGCKPDHTAVGRWVQRYGPELEQRIRRHLKPTNKSWRVDETYVRVQGRWCYLYRAIDSAGATIDFLLSALRGRRCRQTNVSQSAE
jgi:transposase-like protein